MVSAFKNWILPLVLVTGILVSGCSKAKPIQPDASPLTSQGKPVLVVPASFPDGASRQEFVTKAINDGYYKEAKSVLEASIAAQPTATSYLWLGTANYNLGDYDAAISSWTKAAELDPRLAAETVNNMGNAQRDAKQWEDAQASYRKALSLDPTFWTAATNLSVLLKAQGHVDEAIAVLKQAVAANPGVAQLASLLQSYQEQASSNSNG